MIITVTLNAAIDRTLAVPNFRLGRRHRSVEQRSMAGGKGVNVARALKKLGQPVIATGVAGGPTGTRIIEQLTEEAILNDFVRIREESRTSIAVVDPTSGDQTEINERGPTVSESELELFVDKLLYLAKGAAVCVFCGSLPRGVPTELYARPDRRGQQARRDDRARLRGRGAAAGDARRADGRDPERARGGGARRPRVLRRGRPPTALREINELGAREAIMTLPTGCVALVGEDGDRSLYRVSIEQGVVETVSAVGAGDSFLAGYVASRYGGRPADECLRYAVACGAESVQHFGAGVIDPKEVGRLLDEVRGRARSKFPRK